MKKTMMAVPRGGDEGGNVRRVTRAAGCPAVRAAILMMIDVMRIKHLLAEGRKLLLAGGAEHLRGLLLAQTAPR